MNKPINNPKTEVSTLIARLRTAAEGFPMIAEHPSKLMNEAANGLEELDAQLKELKPYIDHKYPCSRRIDPRSDYSCGCGLHAIRNKALEKHS